MALPSTSCGGGCHGGAAEERPGTSCGSAACDCADRAVRKTSSRSLRPLRTYVVSPSSLPDRRHSPWPALRKWRLHPSADADRHTMNSLRVGLSAFVNTSANCGCFSPQRTRWVDPTQPPDSFNVGVAMTRECILPLRLLAIVLDLGGGRLAQIDDRLAGEVAGSDLGVLIHRASPCLLAWRTCAR